MKRSVILALLGLVEANPAPLPVQAQVARQVSPVAKAMPNITAVAQNSTTALNTTATN